MKSLTHYSWTDKILDAGLWLFAFSIMVTKSGLDTSVTIITLAAAVKFLSRPTEIWRGFPTGLRRFCMLAGVFLIVELAGIFISSDTISSIKRLVIHIGYFGLFAGVILMESPSEKIRKLLAVISVISVLVALIAALQYFAGYDFPLNRRCEISKGTRAMGTLGYPNDLGMLLGVLLPFLMAGWIYSDGIRHKIISGAGFAAGVLSLILTFTRGAWVGLAAGLSLMFFVRKDKRKFLWIFMAILALVIVVFPAVKKRALAVFSPEGKETARMFFLKEVPAMIIKKPILGYGPDTFRKNFYSAYPDFPEQGHFHPHNVYLSVAYQTGLVGFVAWLGMFYFIFSYIKSILKEKHSSVGKIPFSTALGWGAAGSLASFFVHGFVDDVFRAYEAPYALFFILGAVFAVHISEKSGVEKNI